MSVPLRNEATKASLNALLASPITLREFIVTVITTVRVDE